MFSTPSCSREAACSLAVWCDGLCVRSASDKKGTALALVIAFKLTLALLLPVIPAILQSADTQIQVHAATFINPRVANQPHAGRQR